MDWIVGKPPFRSKSMNWRKPITSEENVWLPGGCWNAGVRFVQIWSGNDNGFPRRNWDSHEDIHRDHGPLALGMARGIAALVADLKQRGMLEDTLILWTTEFGRMPCAQEVKAEITIPSVSPTGFVGGYSWGCDAWG